jgi:hypothetical protein
MQRSLLLILFALATAAIGSVGVIAPWTGDTDGDTINMQITLLALSRIS